MESLRKHHLADYCWLFAGQITPSVFLCSSSRGKVWVDHFSPQPKNGLAEAKFPKKALASRKTPAAPCKPISTSTVSTVLWTVLTWCSWCHVPHAVVFGLVTTATRQKPPSCRSGRWQTCASWCSTMRWPSAATTPPRRTSCQTRPWSMLQAPW